MDALMACSCSASSVCPAVKFTLRNGCFPPRLAVKMLPPGFDSEISAYMAGVPVSSLRTVTVENSSIHTASRSIPESPSSFPV